MLGFRDLGSSADRGESNGKNMEDEVERGVACANIAPHPLPPLPAPNARSSECAVYSSVLLVVDVVEVNVIMGAGMDSLVVDVVEMNVIVIMSGSMHSLGSCFAVNNSNLAVVEIFIRML